MRVHIVGASGSGTTTLGRALAGRLGFTHLDTDDFYWLPGDPPFQHVRERGARQALLGAALAREPGWVLSGSLCGWGDGFIPLFDLVVFLWIPPEVRMARLRDVTLQPPERCRRLHEDWLAALPCPVVRFLDAAPVEDHLERLETYLQTRQPTGGSP